MTSLTAAGVPIPAGYKPLDLDDTAAAAADARRLDPGSGPSVLARLTRAVPDVPALAEACSQLTSAELTEAARVLATLTQRAEAALVTVTADAIARGTITDSTAAGPAQWVTRIAQGEGPATLITDRARTTAGPLVANLDPDIANEGHVGDTGEEAGRFTSEAFRVPGIEPGHASRIAKIAQASLHASHRVMATAVRDGHASVSVARTAMENLKRVTDVLPGGTHDLVYSYFLALPAGSGTRAVRELTNRIIADYGHPDALDDRETKQQAVEFLRWWDENDGMTRFEGLLSGDHAAVFKHALQALSAPAPATNCCNDPHHRHTSQPEASGHDLAEAEPNGDQPTGRQSSDSEPRLVRLGDDERTPGKRRLDALLMLLNRAAGLIDADPEVVSSGPIRMVVTVDHDTLAGRLRATGGSGSGTSIDGHTITPQTLRRMACEARLIPMVLGSNSEPLDVGRSKRFFTGAVKDAIIARDKHCSYNGCTRPPGWCHVHHIIPWSLGGRTSLLNGALLCEEHHAIVHRDRLFAIVTATTVTWMRPGFTLAA